MNQESMISWLRMMRDWALDAGARLVEIRASWETLEDMLSWWPTVASEQGYSIVGIPIIHDASLKSASWRLIIAFNEGK